MVEVIIGNAGKGKTWSRCTNSRLPFAFNVKLTGLKSSFGKNFQPAYRDLGNWASPVNRAHMKRPTLSFSTSKDDYVDVLCIDPAKEKLTFYGTKNSKSTENPSGRAGFHH